MTDTQIIGEVPINIYQLKRELEAVKKRDKELDFRENKTYEYLSLLTPLKDADELFKKIMELDIPRIRDTHVHKIIDILPQTVNDLSVVLQAYPITVSKENMKKIVDTITEFAPSS